MFFFLFEFVTPVNKTANVNDTHPVLKFPLPHQVNAGMVSKLVLWTYGRAILRNSFPGNISASRNIKTIQTSDFPPLPKVNFLSARTVAERNKLEHADGNRKIVHLERIQIHCLLVVFFRTNKRNTCI